VKPAESFYGLYGKRVLDLVCGILLLLLLAPVLGFLVLLVRLRLGSPVFFCQQRPGFHGTIFTMYKLRTMLDAAEPSGKILSDVSRLTAFGRILRSSSLDELPELWNVLRGDMSLVGPRPLLIQYLDLYSAAQARRHDARPGITGWAQINGRNALTWDQKFTLDFWYVDHYSLSLDLKILALTAWKILKREGINQSGHATAEEFRGNEL